MFNLARPMDNCPGFHGEDGDICAIAHAAAHDSCRVLFVLVGQPAKPSEGPRRSKS